MTSARANFECAGCGQYHADLLMSAKFCSECGGQLTRLFDAINVSTKGHTQAKLVDPLVEPQFNHAQELRDAAKAERLELAKAEARLVVPEAQRSRPQNFAAAFGAIPMDGKIASRATSFPMLPVLGGASKLLQINPNLPFFGPPKPNYSR